MMASARVSVWSLLTSAFWVFPGAPGASYQEAKTETGILLPLPKANRTKKHCQAGKNQDVGTKVGRGMNSQTYNETEVVAQPEHIQSDLFIYI